MSSINFGNTEVGFNAYFGANKVNLQQDYLPTLPPNPFIYVSGLNYVTGSLTDYSGNNYTGSVFSGSAGTAVGGQSALLLEANNISYIEWLDTVPFDPNFMNIGTISLWFQLKTEDAPPFGRSVLFSKGTQDPGLPNERGLCLTYRKGFDPAELQLDFLEQFDNLSVFQTLSLNVWYMGTVRTTGTRAEIWLNNTMLTDTACTGSINNNSRSFYVGFERDVAFNAAANIYVGEFLMYKGTAENVNSIYMATKNNYGY